MSGLSGPITTVTFQDAPAGSEGPVVYTIPAADITESNGTASIMGTWSIDPTSLQELRKGELYVDIYTAEYPDGEIRGQLVAAQ